MENLRDIAIAMGTKESSPNSFDGATQEGREQFYRKIYHQCCSWITHSNKNILVLLGVRKCGKSVCLQQIGETFSNAISFDFKSESIDNCEDFLQKLIQSTDGLFLLDEVTYIPDCYCNLHKIEKSVLRFPNKKIIMTGSQSYNLYYAVNASMGSCADFIHTSFIDFEEWLLYRNKIHAYGEEYIPTEEDVKDYLCNQSDFTKVTDNVAYIYSCIGETIESEAKSGFLAKGAVPVSQGDEQIMKYVLYMSIFSLHNRRNANNLNRYYENIVAVRRSDDIKDLMKKSEFMNRAEERLTKFILRDIKPTATEVRDAVLMLHQLGLVSIVEITNDLNSTEVETFLRTYDKRGLHDKKRFFQLCNICPKYPMFHMNMIYEILFDVPREKVVEMLPDSLLGSMYECLVRGLLSYRTFSDFQYEYYTLYPEQVEVDYVDPYAKEAIEFTVACKHSIKGLKSLDGFSKIIVTGKRNDTDVTDITYKYYPEYLLELSRGIFVSRINTVPWT